jgi:glycine dehydrogenase
LAESETTGTFGARHIGPDESARHTMLSAVGFESLAALVDAAVPSGIRDAGALDLAPPRSEAEATAELRSLAARNTVCTSLIGLGYYGTVTPPVIRRNVLENPAWYTAYTPYQPEISQGRLEALVNFQTMVADLAGLDLANASLLDEATAAAEAMTLLHRANPKAGSVFLVDPDALPQTIDVVRTRAEPLGLEVIVGDISVELDNNDGVFGVLLQYPGASGALTDVGSLIEKATARGARVVVASDLLALTLVTPPGELGADVVVGSAQRFGVPMMYGGPHAGFMAVRSAVQRQLPGRLVGVSVDAHNRPAYRLALQTREQHIRREKATSNICTAQVLLAVVAGLYAAYHGADGLVAIARRVHSAAALFAAAVERAGMTIVHEHFVDTVAVRSPGHAGALVAAARLRGINIRYVDGDTVVVAFDETVTPHVLSDLLHAFGVPCSVEEAAAELDRVVASYDDDGTRIPASMARTSEFLTHPTFTRYRSETEMMRYLRTLADRDLALDRTMIPLGSCTMKLNAAAEMEPISWPELANIHPFVPEDQAEGYLALIHELEAWLATITGYDAVSLQPNAGSQGELAGLLAIRAYHRARDQEQRTVCLIPQSAHGTNAASAAMAGMTVIVVDTDVRGNVDLDDLKHKVADAGDRLGALMITYPSTHGVYEDHIRDVCALVHDGGGQVYLDGANLNALVGLARPGQFGADVSHLNLHKTFCIPHGGGGPGVGPVAVRAHLAPYLPNHPLLAEAGPATGVGAISAAPFGSAGILAIPWMYIAMMGGSGLTDATEVAILNANYVAARLNDAYPVLYTGANGLVAHECIVDLRPITRDTGVTVDDVAKRLIDYGFHAPTMSFPVAGTLMIEPTESEALPELDRFCDAMLAIRAEIDRVASGEWPADDNPLVHAPHTASEVTADEWTHAYPRSVAAYPDERLRATKYWPPVSRIDGAYGDRNVFCSCI